MTFGEWIKESGLTQRGVCRICDLKRGTIVGLLKGSKPRLSTLKKLTASTRSMRIPITKEMFE